MSTERVRNTGFSRVYLFSRLVLLAQTAVAFINFRKWKRRVAIIIRLFPQSSDTIRARFEFVRALPSHDNRVRGQNEPVITKENHVVVTRFATLVRDLNSNDLSICGLRNVILFVYHFVTHELRKRSLVPVFRSRISQVSDVFGNEPSGLIAKVT